MGKGFGHQNSIFSPIYIYSRVCPKDRRVYTTPILLSNWKIIITILWIQEDYNNIWHDVTKKVVLVTKRVLLFSQNNIITRHCSIDLCKKYSGFFFCFCKHKTNESNTKLGQEVTLGSDSSYKRMQIINNLIKPYR